MESERGSRKRLAERGCRDQEGPGGQVGGGRTASAGWEVEASGSGSLPIWTGDPRPE